MTPSQATSSAASPLANLPKPTGGAAANRAIKDAGTGAGAGATTPGSSSSNGTTEASDRFLKLLVTQMQNQDPLNPMDNAQVTSQMAQINTVTGIDKLNTTMGTVNTNLTQMQMLQGAGLVGHQVLVEGDKLNKGADGRLSAGYELGSSAGRVQIDIMNSAGTVIDSIAESSKPLGRQTFSWTPPPGAPSDGLQFKVTALNGETAVEATPLMNDKVDAINTTDGNLTLELRQSGSTAYSKVKAVS
jgi:flagellar basal-body rod modification protein FlgD